LESNLGTQKLLARLAGIYASLTLLLVAVGFYGVMSSRAARRRNEFGIRLALGATRGHIHRLIVGQTLAILLAGVVPGAILSMVAVRAAAHFLYGSANSNAIAIVAATVILVLAGSIAVLIPASRAASADPLESLRSE
jgi:ABC-type antimicrobial peptide transport system permease subunit